MDSTGFRHALLDLSWLGLAGRDPATLALTAATQGAKTVETLWDEQRCWLEEKRQLTGSYVGGQCCTEPSAVQLSYIGLL